MAFYSVCSLCVEADFFPQSYDPFFIPVNKLPKNIDLSIKQASWRSSDVTMQKTNVLPNICIFKGIFPPNQQIWAYEAYNGMLAISVDEDYTNAEYFYQDTLNFFGKNEIRKMYSPLFRILIECKLIKSGFTILHSACVELDGVAFAFTGPSGIGKSSRAQKWCDLLDAVWISGDRPAIDVNKGVVYGVPWDGKEAVYRNTCCPLAAIFNVKRSKKTLIRSMSLEEKRQVLCEQTFFPLWDTNLAVKSFESITYLINSVPMFELCCDITDQSIYDSYKMIGEMLNLKRG